MFRTLQTGPVAYMVYTLEHTLVARIEHGTQEESGSSFRLYMNPLRANELAEGPVPRAPYSEPGNEPEAYQPRG